MLLSLRSAQTRSGKIVGARHASPHHRKAVIGTAFILIGLLVLSGCSLAGEPVPAGPIETPNPNENLQPFAVAAPPAELPPDIGYPLELPDAVHGASLYAARCAACHGLDGGGVGEVSATLTEQGAQLPDFTDVTLLRQRSPQDLFRTITDGRIEALMPPWGQELTEAERWDLAYFLYSFSLSDETLAQGREIFQANCVRCHSADGRGGGVEATDFVPNLTDPTLMLARSPVALFETVSLGVGKLMPPTDDLLSEEERWAVVDFTRTFSYVAGPPVSELAEVGVLPATTLPGTISGTVFNRTTNETLADHDVLLHGLVVQEAGIEEIITLQATTDVQGGYRFDDVPMDIDNLVYVVDLAYAGIEFNNAAVIAPGETTSLELPIDVYETTQDPSAISVETLHVVVSRQGPDSILIGQIYVYSNASDSAYVSEISLSETRRGTVTLPVPLEAFGLAFQDGELGSRFVQIGGSVLDTAVVLPGRQSHSVIMTYLLPYDGDYTLTLPLLYRTDLVNVISEADDIDIQADSLALSDSPDDELEEFVLLIGTDFTAGTQLTVAVSDATRSFSLARGGGLIIALGAIVLAMAGFGLWLWRGRTGDVTSDSVAESSAAATDRQRELMQAIANLDDEFEAGRVAKAQYEAQRARLKAELVTLMEGQGG